KVRSLFLPNEHGVPVGVYPYIRQKYTSPSVGGHSHGRTVHASGREGAGADTRVLPNNHSVATAIDRYLGCSTAVFRGRLDRTEDTARGQGARLDTPIGQIPANGSIAVRVDRHLRTDSINAGP